MTSNSPEYSLSARFRGQDAKKGKPDGSPNGWVILAAWGPCGYAPRAPGTAGTLGAIPLFWLLQHLSLPIYLVTVMAFIALSIHAAHSAGKYWKTADASPIVIDEVAGYLVTMAGVAWSWPAALLGFALFRIYDVVKPWPASFFDRRVKNGFGVVMDDVVAGVFAWASLMAITLALRYALGCDMTHWWCGTVLP